jgi:hypothetical protein
MRPKTLLIGAKAVWWMDVLNGIPCGSFLFQPSTEHTNLLRTFPFALKSNFNFKMRLFGFPTAVLALTGVVKSVAVEKRDLLTDLQDQTMENLKAAEANGTLGKRGSCNIFNAAVRRDWYDLSRQV